MDVVRTQRKMARRSNPPSTTTNFVESSFPPPSTSESHEAPAVLTPTRRQNNVNSLETTNHPEDHHNNNDASPAAPPPPRKFPSLLRRRRARRASSEPPQRRKRFLEDHYRVDVERRVVLPGVPRYEQDYARDAHDCFNLVMLLPVILLDVMNWNWDKIMYEQEEDRATSIADAWTGEYFAYFFAATVCYFLLDLVWIVAVPSCVKSPATIIQHHLATILYLFIPYKLPQYQWCMGACMSVELNTWFLIARRVLNKQGHSPWTISFSVVSIRVKIISIFFYATWIGIRCILYPALMLPFYDNWVQYSQQVGTRWNLVFLCVPLHACFCLLNLKWTYDLVMSKIRYWRRHHHKGKHYDSVSKGL